MSRFKRFSRRAGRSVFGVCFTSVLLVTAGLDSDEALYEEFPRASAGPVPFEVLVVRWRQVDLLFKGFFERPFGQQPQLMSFWDDGRTTHFVAIGESLHGYVVCLPEKRFVEIQYPGRPPRTVERLFITLKKDGADPIVIEQGRTERVTERIAILRVTDGNWTVQYRNEKLSEDKDIFDLFEGCDIIAKGEGAWRRFRVTHVSDETVTLEESYKHVLELISRAGNPAVQK